MCCFIVLIYNVECNKDKEKHWLIKVFPNVLLVLCVFDVPFSSSSLIMKHLPGKHPKHTRQYVSWTLLHDNKSSDSHPKGLRNVDDSAKKKSTPESAPRRCGEPLWAHCFQKERKNHGQPLSAYKLAQAVFFTLPVQSEMADGQSKRVAGEVEVFVEAFSRAKRDRYSSPN